ncbi:dihydrolipoyllysine-residue acetyltransferase [Planctomicrobium piriforme]|uniref:Acetyltransferase component of pyruvate dehydrogenase complex n=1 Tax=Planctomicrobium piriforme TaxID=1576369 RepID=A0A1I3HV01_9PLAN|nr:dihydrolipoyllysine-residue acetyltransferase [Planctomicrobium piriforme]SFI39380.1 pyruvate dehydrogenase E2 component (dihydrolipoamide acetyltransferase) [Planctomicrobium piriforme]
MSFELRLPNIGEGVEEADIAEVLVSVGDTIEANQTVMELETEKAVVELPCPQAGKVEKILVSAGDTVRVDAPVMIIDTGSNGSAAAPEKKTEKKPESKQPAEQKPAEKKPAAEAPRKEPVPAPAEKKPTETKTEKKADKPEPQTEMVEGTIEFQLPPLGEGVNSADVADILVSEGDVIEANASVMELETEKAVVELPCPHPGKIKKIHVKAGDSVKVGATVLTIETSSKVAKSSAAASPAAPEKKPEPKAEKPAEKAEPKSAPAPAAKTAAAPPAKTSAAPAATASEPDGLPVPAAPSTRRLARQLGVTIGDVKGTGGGGRITQEDVQAFVRTRLQQSASLPARSTTSSNTGLAAGSLAPPPLPDFTRFGLVEREKMNKIARTAAENLTLSWNVIPHVTQHDRADITDLEAARKRFAAGVGKNGPKITMTAIVIKALAKCLQIYPKFNSSLDPETNEIVYKKFYNIGCAVDTPNGLLVPVVKECDKKNILEIAQAITELAEKARDRKLPVDAMQGATCTVTNLGGIGGVGFTPIVNYPEVCILGMSRGQPELRMIDGKIEERLMLPLSLSYDHRVVNGADAARFVATLCNLLADPFQLLTAV